MLNSARQLAAVERLATQLFMQQSGVLLLAVAVAAFFGSIGHKSSCIHSLRPGSECRTVIY
jgi:hypothetical protein